MYVSSGCCRLWYRYFYGCRFHSVSMFFWIPQRWDPCSRKNWTWPVNFIHNHVYVSIDMILRAALILQRSLFTGTSTLMYHCSAQILLNYCLDVAHLTLHLFGQRSQIPSRIRIDLLFFDVAWPLYSTLVCDFLANACWFRVIHPLNVAIPCYSSLYQAILYRFRCPKASSGEMFCVFVIWKPVVWDILVMSIKQTVRHWDWHKPHKQIILTTYPLVIKYSHLRCPICSGFTH